MSVHPSDHMYQRGSHWTNFLAILYWGLLCRCVCKLQIWSKSDKNIGHSTWRFVYVYVFHSSTKYFLVSQECKGNQLFQSRGNTDHSYVIDRCMYINISTSETHFLRFLSNNGYANAPRYYVTCSLPTLFFIYSREYFIKQSPVPCIFLWTFSPFIRDHSAKPPGWKEKLLKKASWQVDGVGICLIFSVTHLSQGGFSWISVSHCRRRPGEYHEKGS
jgi:hypothetical protein